MSNPGNTNQGQPDPERKTLGDLLYRGKAKVAVTEDHWLKIVYSIAAGDQAALHSLYQQTYRLVFTLIVRITNNRETAEELTLDVYHEVWRRASAYNPAGGPVIGWIMNQARCRAIDRLRFEQRKKRINGYPEYPLTGVPERDPQEAYQLEEQSRMLRHAMEVLTAAERQVIETAFFSEMTYQEAASKLNQPVGTVKTRIRSGLTKLRQALTSDPKAL